MLLQKGNQLYIIANNDRMRLESNIEIRISKNRNLWDFRLWDLDFILFFN